MKFICRECENIFDNLPLDEEICPDCASLGSLVECVELFCEDCKNEWEGDAEKYCPFCHSDRIKKRSLSKK